MTFILTLIKFQDIKRNRNYLRFFFFQTIYLYMRLTEKDINYIVNECINKLLVKESLSSVVYHFCSIGKALQICESDVFKLQSVFSAISDNLSKRGKMFYMSFTRQYNGTLGYSRGKHVRITFDGDMLNQNFNGKPVDY